MKKNRYLEQYRKVGNRIAYYRRAKNYSQEALAEKVGISKSYLGQIEAPNSTYVFSLEMVFAIAEGLELDVSVFFLPINEDYLK